MVSTRRKRLAQNTKKKSQVNIIKNNNEKEEAATIIKDEGRGSNSSGGGGRKYEEFREQRIKENKERMLNLGILDLSLKLNSSKLFKKKKPTPPNLPSHNNNPPIPLPLSVSPRRSSRLKNRTPVNYKETSVKSKRGASLDLEIRLREGSKPEIYTEEHEKLLGDCKTVWTLFVDGYGEDGKRIYDPEIGETCHQCRQKTLGRHTHCSKCKLVQGQFCGDCLYMRYGENVIEVNENPSWICPVCRGICNCSLCRKARGWEPTGPIYRKVAKLGFKSVAHYLIQARRKQNSRDSVVASVDPEGREMALSDEGGSQLATYSESLNADEHQDRFPHLQSDDDNVEMEAEEEKQMHINDVYDDDKLLHWI